MLNARVWLAREADPVLSHGKLSSSFSFSRNEAAVSSSARLPLAQGIWFGNVLIPTSNWWTVRVDKASLWTYCWEPEAKVPMRIYRIQKRAAKITFPFFLITVNLSLCSLIAGSCSFLLFTSTSRCHSSHFNLPLTNPGPSTLCT